MKAVRLIGIAGLVLAIVCVGVGIFLPREWSVERSVVIRAAPEKIHEWIETPRRWPEWLGVDEAGKPVHGEVSFEGPERGVGAAYVWRSASSRGRMLITHSDPKTGVHLEESIESDTPNAKGILVYTAAGDGLTRVTWTDTGTLPPVVGGWFRGVMNERLGAHFEQSLLTLKSKVE